MLAKQLQGAAKSAVPQYIEDVFSTWLYTGTGSSPLTITNNIDLSTKGGMVYIKQRNGTGYPNIFDTERGVGKQLYTSLTNAQYSGGSAFGVSAFNNNGFTLSDVNSDFNAVNGTFVSWTFRKQAKFFDVVTYTGNGVTGRTISHNLGSVPGCIIVKTLSTANQWSVYHRSLGATQAIMLQATNAAFADTIWNNTTPTSTVFTVGSQTDVNANGVTYVAYLFAHDAGGFGAAGTDNVISCGSFTTDGSGNATVSLGYEPQWLLQKSASGSVGTGNWFIADNMRGLPVGSAATLLRPNLADAESTGGTQSLTATGFSVSGFQATTTYIYIAIRRGPMRTPTSGTSVFSPVAFSGTGTNSRQIDSGFPPDLLLDLQRNQVVSKYWYTRLFGNGSYLASNNTNAATGTSTAYGAQFDKIQNGYQQGTSDSTSANATGTNYVNHLFRRAPGFFDVVCYTGDGTTGRYINHNLTVAPELIILKNRSTISFQWSVYQKDVFNVGGKYELVLNSNAAQYDINNTNTPFSTTTAPTSTQIRLGSGSACNSNAVTYVAYLFATVAGVSKVGTYVGNATVNGQSQNIDCGFTAGARFVMIKCTSTTGDWYVFDSARGIVAGNDPFLFLNSTAAETTSLDCVDPYSQGFTVVQQSGGDVNVNNATYIFLAIA